MRAIAWATSRELIEGSLEVVPVIVAGTVVLAHYYNQWFLAQRETRPGADAEARELMATLESYGAKIAAGPVEFDFSSPVTEEEFLESWALSVIFGATNAMCVENPWHGVLDWSVVSQIHYAQLSTKVTVMPHHPMIPGAS